MAIASWRHAWALAFCVAGLSGGICSAAPSVHVSFNDPANSYASFYSVITSTVQAAGQDWFNALGYTTNTTLDVRIGFDSIPTANGASVSASWVGKQSGIDIYEFGAATKLRDGVDVNGAAPDIVFNIGINGYLQTELWFGSGTVPSHQTDARSVFAHEFGHAFGFNGWRDWATAALPGTTMSTFDRWVSFDAAAAGGPTAFFIGPQAMTLYGGAIPLTYGNLFHLGNNGPRAGADLIPNLMNGVVYNRGTTYVIDPLTLAIMGDIGLPQVSSVAPIPEPSTYAMMALGLLCVGTIAWRRRTPSTKLDPR